MEHWQFLIQKQGDRSWQSLESPTLKISPGKYRILARSPLPNTDVEVRINHASIQEFPPKRRIFKRLRRTDANGLMAVIPFTDLKLGIWEIRCSGDLMTDMLGESWQHTLLLNVLSSPVNEQLLSDGSDHSDHNFDSSAMGTDEISPTVTSDYEVDDTDTLSPILEDILIHQPVNPVLLKGETAEQIVQNLLDLALPSSESWDEDPSEQNVLPAISPPLLLQVSLEKDTYIAQWGTDLQVNGNVISADIENLTDERLSVINIYQLHIVTELRSPLESAILTTVKQTLADQILPFSFSSNIQIPHDCESKLILGNINIYGTITQGNEVTLLGNHPFSITADVTQLLRITSQTQNTPDPLTDHHSLAEENVAEQSEPVTLDLELFNLVKTPKLAQFQILKPAGKITLPPQIKAVILSERISPQLPTLPRIHKSMISANSGVADSFTSLDGVKKPTKIRPINLEKLVIRQVKTSFPFLKRLKSEPEPETLLSTPENIPQLSPSDQYQKTTDLELTENTVAEIPRLETDESLQIRYPETSPLIQKWMAKQGYLLDEGIELVYQDHNPDDEQLNPESPPNINNENITVAPAVNDLDSETAPVLDIPEHLRLDITDLDSETAPVLDIPEHLRLDITETTPTPEPPPNTPTWLSEEIVLDDVYMTPVDEYQPVEPEPPDLSLQQREFLPTPQLFLPSGELLAGTSVKIRLELPVLSSKIVIKLWVEDYQTRGLLDGPHLLQDLHITPWGNWEATTQILIPFGCLEILVGAIALDVNSQQESHKVTMVKTVIPPDLSTIEVDEVLGL